MDWEQLTAYSCGGSAGFSRPKHDSPASLLATRYCDLMDRDTHMWGYSRRSVNDSLERDNGSLWKVVNCESAPVREGPVDEGIHLQIFGFCLGSPGPA